MRVEVAAQLVERLLPTLEARSSNPVIGKIYIEHFLSTEQENKKKKKRTLQKEHLLS